MDFSILSPSRIRTSAPIAKNSPSALARIRRAMQAAIPARGVAAPEGDPTRLPRDLPGRHETATFTLSVRKPLASAREFSGVRKPGTVRKAGIVRHQHRLQRCIHQPLTDSVPFMSFGRYWQASVWGVRPLFRGQEDCPRPQRPKRPKRPDD